MDSESGENYNAESMSLYPLYVDCSMSTSLFKTLPCLSVLDFSFAVRLN